MMSSHPLSVEPSEGLSLWRPSDRSSFGSKLVLSVGLPERRTRDQEVRGLSLTHCALDFNPQQAAGEHFHTYSP